MSYKITFRDRTTLIVPTEVGDKLKNAMMSDESPETITLAGDVFRTSQIVSVVKSNLPTAQDQDLKRPALSSAPQYNCVLAGTSIQVAIHRAIKKQFPSDWAKRVQDKKYRDKVRQQIRMANPNKAWCDMTKEPNEHACLDYKPKAGAGISVASLL